MEFWHAFIPNSEDWDFDQEEGRKGLRAAVRTWLEENTAGISVLRAAFSSEPDERVTELIVERLVTLGALIRLERDLFEEQSLPVLVQLMLEHPEDLSVGEDVLGETAGMFFCPVGYYPWREMADILEDPIRSQHARDALAHHLICDHYDGDDLWPFALYTRLASREFDAEVLSRYVASQEDLHPSCAVLAAEGIARTGMQGLQVMADMLTSANRSVRVVGVLGLGLTGFKEVQPMLEAVFGLDPRLHTIIANAWTWTAAPEDVERYHEVFYSKADPGQRLRVGNAWLAVSDTFRRPNPRWEVPWPLHYLPPLPDEDTLFPRGELMPLILDALASEIDPEEQLAVQSFEDAVGGPSTLEEWSKEWEENTFDRFESEGRNYGIPTGTVVPFDSMGTFFLHQRMQIIALCEGRAGLPIERVAVEIWETAVEKMITEEIEPESDEADSLRLILDTLRWAAARGANCVEDVEELLAKAVIRTMTWVLDDPVEARVVEAQLALEAAQKAAQ